LRNGGRNSEGNVAGPVQLGDARIVEATMKLITLALATAGLLATAAPTVSADEYVVEPRLLVVESEHYPSFGVHAVGNNPRGFAFADNPDKNPAFFALAAAAKASGKKLKVTYSASYPDKPSIEGVTKVEIVD
jgi:hypothetical protein